MYFFISRTSSSGLRAVQKVVHISGLEQNVHSYGQPRLARIGIDRPRFAPCVRALSM
jgi:hypothetical protein